VVREIIQLSDGRIIVTAGINIKIFIFNQKEAKWKVNATKQVCDNDWFVRSLLQYDSTRIICGIHYKDKVKIQLWNVDSWECEKSFSINEFSTNLFILPNQKLLSSARNGRTDIWDIEKAVFAYNFFTERDGSHHEIQLASGNLCTCNFKNWLICIWDYKTGEKIKSFKLRYRPNDDSHHKLLRDGRVVFICRYNSDDARLYAGCLLLYNIETGVCDQIIHADVNVFRFAQCKDGSLCCYSDYGSKSIFFTHDLCNDCAVSVIIAMQNFTVVVY
jgi:hypothetical protein